ncbi:e2d4624d-ae6a-4e5b-abfe-3d30f284277c [Sclerotinia trifoliorum]|uniref:E2d4624d-ae6a-4e5b-abfe-3d30f284277c n=1 Tax=Sclerotinia trifoliorum TaxID=28548 RepID=A0A8H2ZTL0_9HELO|nr:e2d4624d-ae6a-4e5b-abfe-3d30f284277c [Sclerotinia trifoliorum]
MILRPASIWALGACISSALTAEIKHDPPPLPLKSVPPNDPLVFQSGTPAAGHVWVDLVPAAVKDILTSSSTSPSTFKNLSSPDDLKIAKRQETWSRPELVGISNSGIFKMDTPNMEKFDWAPRYKDWETLALHDSGSGKSLSARYGEEKLGKPHWFCDPDNGCTAMPTPLEVLEFVDVSQPGMTRDEKIEEAQARYWAGMSYYLVFRTGTHTINALARAQDFVLARIDSIIYDFTKQDNEDTILKCEIKKWFINMIYQYTGKALRFGMSRFVQAEEGKEIKDAGLNPPSWKKLSKADPFMFTEFLKQLLDFTLPMEHTVGKAIKHPQGNEGESSIDFLRLTSERYTSDLYCGHMDGIAGTGSDNMVRIADASFHISEIMKQYIQNLSDVFRALNGFTDVQGTGKTMSDWMFNADYEAIISRLDSIDIAKEAQSFSQKLSGYFISAAWASNKCYMKCQTELNRGTVKKRCHAKKFASERFCPEDYPDTLCQVNCYTMMDSGNHEKQLIGLDKLSKHGFDIEDIKKTSWEYSRELKKLHKPQLDYVNGKEFTFNGDRSAITLSVSTSKSNRIADKPRRSRNFPCFSGQDYRGMDTESHLTNLGMGFGSTDWGEETKANPRAWEMFQHHCPEQTRKMAPLTRYLNIICGQRLLFPEKTWQDGLVHRRVMKPDIEGKNREVCQTLREKTENMDENTANYLFCSGRWPESSKIFSNEKGWVYTDWNSRWHRGSGLKFMLSHKYRCMIYMMQNRNFNVGEQWANMDWHADPTKVVDDGAHVNGTVLALDDDDVKDLETMPEDSLSMDPAATKELKRKLAEFEKSNRG